MGARRESNVKLLRSLSRGYPRSGNDRSDIRPCSAYADLINTQPKALERDLISHGVHLNDGRDANVLAAYRPCARSGPIGVAQIGVHGDRNRLRASRDVIDLDAENIDIDSLERQIAAHLSRID